MPADDNAFAIALVKFDTLQLNIDNWLIVAASDELIPSAKFINLCPYASILLLEMTYNAFGYAPSCEDNIYAYSSVVSFMIDKSDFAPSDNSMLSGFFMKTFEASDNYA